MSEEKQPLNDDYIINYGNHMRHDLVVHLTTDSEGNQRLPHDSESVNAIRGLLKDSDSSVYTRRRVMTEEASAENDKRAADILERILDQSPHVTRDSEDTVDNYSGPNVDESQLPKFDIETSATSQVGEEIDLDEINRYGRQVRKGVAAED